MKVVTNMRKKLMTKEMILDQAGELVKNQGLDACNMRDLATGLGVAVGTIYNYYTSQDELFLDLFEASWTKTIEKLSRVNDREVYDEEAFRQYISILINEISNRKGLGSVVFGKLGVSKEFARSPLKLFEGIADPLLRIIASSDKNQHLDEDGIRMIAEWILYAVNAFFLFERSNQEAFIEELIHRFI